MPDATSTPAALWYASPDGKARTGPLTPGQVRAMIAAGTLHKGSLLWREGMPAWAMLADLPEFTDALASAPANLPAGLQMPATPGDLAPAPRKTSATVVTLIVVGSILGLCLLSAIPIGILLPAMGKARGTARQIKDSTQIRGVHQSMILWAQNNADLYPQPSLIDKANATVRAGEPKDLPSHIMSIMIYTGFMSPELCISPAETNPNFAVYVDYAFTNPAAAADPFNALWDPAFRAYPIEHTSHGLTPQGVGNLSYAIMPPVGARRARWSNTFSATEAIVGNRGPAYDAVGSGASQTWTLHPDSGGTVLGNTEVGTSSYTLLIHGGRSTWEGNIAYNDNHVNFETAPDPPYVTFRFTGMSSPGNLFPDNHFVDENDATRAKDSTTGVNNANSNNLLRGWNGGEFDPKTGKLLSIPAHLWFD
ncbi:MAG: hypothetical protein HBSAPP03_11890 [Phycisphaerae bacterium]|nr:MAG: hypothetical protein HBSAPP03_11890 [Phycisphaerae bacterium]